MGCENTKNIMHLGKRQLLSEKGELLAVSWLQERGYRILHRNWRFSRYEIDIIAERAGILHFIEVKTRSGNVFGEPEEAVTDAKLNRMMLAAEEYQYQYPQYLR